jgi:putative tryptophan/tyrosine transport system substrate-binding protein
MVDGMQPRRGGTTGHTQGSWLGCLRLWSLTLVMLLLSRGLLLSGTDAAERARPLRIGALTDSWGSTPHMAGLRDGLLALGYREREDFVIGVRFTQGNHALLPAAAHELVRYGVDLLFATSAQPAQAAQRATTQIPIVFAWVEDPVGLGLVQSFARPGGNITGVTNLTLELGPKRLELFRELVPGLKRVLYPYDATHAPSVALAQGYRDAARHLGMELVEKPVRTEEEVQAVLAQVRESQVDGVVQPPSLSLNIPGFMVEATAARGIPTVFESAFFVKRGGLASYAPDDYASGWQAARLVDKILKGTDPAEIPVEVNTKIQFVVNLKTAQALGLTIPPTLLFQADEVIR